MLSARASAQGSDMTNGVDNLVAIVVEEVVALGSLVGSQHSLVRLVASDDL